MLIANNFYTAALESKGNLPLRLFSLQKSLLESGVDKATMNLVPRRGVIRLIPTDLYTPSPVFNVLEVLGNRNKADDHELVMAMKVSQNFVTSLVKNGII